MTEQKQPTDWRNVAYYARGAFAVILSLAVLIGGGWFAYSKVHEFYTEMTTPDDDFIGDGGEPVEVVIPQGAGITQIGDILYEAGVVKSVRKFRSEAQKSGEAAKLQFGRFTLKKELPAEKALAMLLDAKNLKRIWVTFPEGWTVQEQHDRIAKELKVSPEALKAATEKRGELGLPGWAGEAGLQGFLFPARYDVQEPIDPVSIMKKQVAEFNTVAERTELEERAEKLKITPMEALTIASIIEGEVHDPDYQPMVASVIYNRLEKNMRLDMDSTVHFIFGKSGGVTTTQEQRQSDSPYNTYKVKGLPPGPINNPGETAIKAALSPADSEALYFVTVDLDTGETLFADTLEDHEKNVEVFQQYCKDNPGKCSGK